MRRFLWLLPVVAGCEAQSGAETALAFVVIFATLTRIFVDPDAR